ncbi:hypothetical protein ACVGWX_08110, partial [Enterobacter hormaechei]
ATSSSRTLGYRDMMCKPRRRRVAATPYPAYSEPVGPVSVATPGYFQLNSASVCRFGLSSSSTAS